MNVLCPACEHAIPLGEGAAELSCDSCGLRAPVSRVGTAPGVGLVPLAVDLTGRTVGGYRIEARVGAGGMGTVWRAIPAAGGAPVALKVLHGDLRWYTPDARARFRREVEALRRLDHPNIVRIVDHGHDDATGVDYLVTDLVDGPDLAKIARERRPSVDEAVDLVAQACAGVAHAHAAGIVHRDLKPANLLRDAGGAVRVADFGLAQIAGVDSVSLTRTDVVIGTLAYLAPEQRAGRAVDGRADVFALGVILYELLCGTPPVGRFPLPGELGRGDHRHDAIVERALAPDPEKRYPSVDALAAALRGLGVRRRRWPIAAAVAGIAACVAALIAAPGLFARSEPRAEPPAPTPALTPTVERRLEPAVAPVDAAPAPEIVAQPAPPPDAAPSSPKKSADVLEKKAKPSPAPTKRAGSPVKEGQAPREY